MKSFLWGAVAMIALMAIGGVAFVWSGIYNVAANAPHWGVTFWILGEARERSVSVHSKGILPPPLTGQKLVDIGFPHYHAACRLCHGAPGYSPFAFAQGLYPKPPVLTSQDVQRELDDREIYWVVKNGLKMTGMPSFGARYKDEEIWGIVTFLRRLPNMASEEYSGMVKTVAPG